MSNWSEATNGWRSKGTEIELECPKCTETDATMFETTIHSKTTVSYFCNTCAHSWVEPRQVKELR